MDQPTSHEIEEFRTRLESLAREIDAWTAKPPATDIATCQARANALYGESIDRWMPVSLRAWARGLTQAIPMLFEVQEEVAEEDEAAEAANAALN